VARLSTVLRNVHVLVVNGGSSSLKLRLLDGDDQLVAGEDASLDEDDVVQRFVDECGDVDAVGHRVVHGGARFVRPCRVDDHVLDELEALVPLAPLHQPIALAGIRSLARLLPGVPAVACFDTAFHASITSASATYPLPLEWRERHGLRRFGFHGLSHAYASRQAVALAGHPIHRLVTCHLGAGSSLSAVVDGRCVDTTMGFTPNEGVPMATRSGSVDVGMLMWLLDNGVDHIELSDGLQHRSGLLGLAGTADMREADAAAERGVARAVLARDVWVQRVSQAVAAMAVSAGGVDALVFTGGIGENSASLRARVLEQVSWFASDAEVFVIEAREDIEIARGTREALGAGD
jgi:acetate kinase